MAQEWMLKTLVDLGFKQQDAEVYVFLTLNGSQKASEITMALKTYRRQVYRALNRLKQRQIVTAGPNLPARFTAVPLDKVIDMMVKANAEEANRLEQEKEEMFNLWKKNVRKDS